MNTTFSIGGAQLTVATEALFRAWLEKTLAASSHSPATTPPASEAGERYVGSINRADGSGHHIYLKMVGDKATTWPDAMQFAAENNAELPDRIEGALLFATLKAEFKPEWYWTREQHAGDDDCAWCQDFGGGYQNRSHKNIKFRVVLVRRVAIQSFSH